MSNKNRDATRDAARSLYRSVHGLRVAQDANVIPIVDGGAFVEAQVWVPQHEIDVAAELAKAREAAEAAAKAEAAAMAAAK